MKLLLIDVNCKNNSTGKIVYDLFKEANANGNEAAICYGRGAVIAEKRIFKFGIDLETYFHAFMTRITGFTGCYSYFSTKRLIKFIKKFHPDVVHIHELHAYFVNIQPLLVYLKKNKIKTIWTFHCEFMYTGKCGHAFECEQWKSECNHCPKLREYPKSWFFDFTNKMFCDKKRCFSNYEKLTIVTPSNWLANRVKYSFLKEKKITVIHNGIDTSIFYPKDASELKTSLNIKSNTKVLLGLAPDLMSEIKGGQYILQLAEHMQHEDVRFILIGCDKKKSYENIQMLMKISDQHLLAEYYSMADVFVICSKKENFPTTCLEAQCCGTPIAGFNTGGTEETDLSGENMFVDYGDIEGLKNKILYYLNQSDKQTSLATLAKKSFSKLAMYKNYENCYKN